MRHMMILLLGLMVLLSGCARTNIEPVQFENGAVGYKASTFTFAKEVSGFSALYNPVTKEMQIKLKKSSPQAEVVEMLAPLFTSMAAALNALMEDKGPIGRTGLAP